ncbi:MAG: M20/M25/M40 family metallo-hydrolase [Pseudomonadota bacterium]|jgi:acetylornithine deacetylase/succinyl-diaminopimelate desuccinylase-like protein
MKRRNLFVLVGTILPVLALAAAPDRPASPAEYQVLAHDLFAELVGLDTTHAVGSAKAVEALAARFRAAGFADGDIWTGGPRPDKMNIVVRLRGRGKAKAVLFNSHLDVVEATRDTWSFEPFALTEKDGWYYGRGAIDVKNEVAIISANLIRMQREGQVPDGDVIAFFNTDEEAGGDANGVEWMVAEHRDVIDAGLVINGDAGKVLSLAGKPLWNTLQTSEKAYATYELTANGAGGHSSLPRRDNTIARLARALVKIDAYQFPVRLGETSRDYLRAMQPRATSAEAAAIARLLGAPSDTAALDTLRDNAVINAQLHSTCPVTLVSGGQSESALPMRAVATLQCRLLPDEKADAVVAAFVRVIDDPSIAVKATWGPLSSPAEPLDPAVTRVVETLTGAFWPGIPVVPVMSQGASDNVYFRRGGFHTYGVSGTVVDEEDLRAHGRDERVGVARFYDSLEFNYRLMRALSGAR